MGIISTILLVAFVIICFLIIALVLLQNEEGDSLGGIFAGGSNSAFGSRSANVLTRATYVVVILFFVSAFFLAFINKSPSGKGVQEAARKAQLESTDTEWFLNEDMPVTDASNLDVVQPETVIE